MESRNSSSTSTASWKLKIPFLICCLLASCVWATSAEAQAKRPLDHSDYDKWNSLRGSNISGDGNWASFSVNPVKGQGTLTIRNLDKDKEYNVKGGGRLRFTFDSKFAIFTVSPDPELLKKLRKEKKKPNELPKPKLQILDLSVGSLSTIDGVTSFQMPAKGDGWIAFMAPKTSGAKKLVMKSSSVKQNFKVTEKGLVKSVKKSGKKTPSKKTEKGKKSDPKKKDEKKKTDGGTLVLHSLKNGTQRTIPFVKNYRFSEKGKYLAYTTSSADGSKDGLTVVNLSEMSFSQILSGKGNYGQAVFSKNEDQIAILTDKDDYKTYKSSWSLYRWSEGNESAEKIVDHKTEGMPKGWWISSTSNPSFFEDGSRIVFNTKPMPESREKDKPKKKDEKPKAKLDLWHWQDPFLQPQQLLQVAREKNRSYTAIFNIEDEKMLQLADKRVNSVRLNARSSSKYAIGVEADQWRKMRSWDLQSFSNSFLIDLDTGQRISIFKEKRFSPSLSPDGKFITWWDAEKKAFFAYQTKDIVANSQTATAQNITKSIPHAVYNELHDTPSLPGPYGTAGWLKDDSALLVYTRWDIWQVDPSGSKEPVCVTGEKGLASKTRLRMVRLDTEKRFVDLSQPQILSILRHETKASGYARLTWNGEKAELKDLLVLDEAVGGLRKAKKSDRVLLTRSTFRNYPDLWASSLKFENVSRLSDANPQQKNYLWGSAELVNWKATDGTDLQGIVYKPDNFDPKKKYPLMVYFYERNSDTLHRYTAPAAGRSIINFSFYVSRGYVVFIPDVVYKTGEPGPSAENCILPGVENIVAKGFIDKKRIGMQGHSWGGYQTAYLVTVTDMFACAESGAPVSNMTSAYGGIRWGTGMSRMFQYEKTQSRIGATLWKDRENYIKNSPVFFADKINTPLLILHNDKDTAVPWYQGIELFVAMRRLSKPAWMLNYNGDPHWVMSDANRMDFAKRMQQFFDHYLKGEPMPVWMAKGIPAVDKGKKFGFEPANKKTKASAGKKAKANPKKEKEAAEK